MLIPPVGSYFLEHQSKVTSKMKVLVVHIPAWEPCWRMDPDFCPFFSPGLQRRRLIPALTLDTSSSSSSSSSPSHRSAKQAITSSSSSSSSSQGACWVDGPLGLQPPPTSLRVTADTTENFEIKVYKIDDVERLQRRRDRRVSKVRGGRAEETDTEYRHSSTEQTQQSNTGVSECESENGGW